MYTALEKGKLRFKIYFVREIRVLLISCFGSQMGKCSLDRDQCSVHMHAFEFGALDLVTAYSETRINLKIG